MQIKEFESGRQQVAEGLDTTIATQPDGDIKSIRSRLGKDFDYMAKDGENLNYEKAEMVVEKAREYQDDSTVAVTEELTGRIVGAIAGLASAVLGIIGAILTLLGLRKTGFAAAILSAAAAAVCAFKLGTAGTVMSEAAGSQTGTLPMVAAILCAAVALAVAVTGMVKKTN